MYTLRGIVKTQGQLLHGETVLAISLIISACNNFLIENISIENPKWILISALIKHCFVKLKNERWHSAIVEQNIYVGFTYLRTVTLGCTCTLDYHHSTSTPT